MAPLASKMQSIISVGYNDSLPVSGSRRIAVNCAPQS
jgi:hypothetical protein